MKSHSLLSTPSLSVHIVFYMRFEQDEHKPSPKCWNLMPGANTAWPLRPTQYVFMQARGFPWQKGQENGWLEWQGEKKRRNGAESHLWVRKMKWKWKLSGKPPGAEKIKLFLSLPRLLQIMLNYRRQIFIHVHNIQAIQPILAVKCIGFLCEPIPFGFCWPYCILWGPWALSPHAFPALGSPWHPWCWNYYLSAGARVWFFDLIFYH